METLKIGKRNYKVVQFQGEEVVLSQYPNFHKHGVRALYVLSFGNTMYTVNKFTSGNFSKPLKVFQPA